MKAVFDTNILIDHLNDVDEAADELEPYRETTGRRHMGFSTGELDAFRHAKHQRFSG